MIWQFFLSKTRLKSNFKKPIQLNILFSVTSFTGCFIKSKLDVACKFFVLTYKELPVTQIFTVVGLRF